MLNVAFGDDAKADGTHGGPTGAADARDVQILAVPQGWVRGSASDSVSALQPLCEGLAPESVVCWDLFDRDREHQDSGCAPAAHCDVHVDVHRDLVQALDRAERSPQHDFHYLCLCLVSCPPQAYS